MLYPAKLFFKSNETFSDKPKLKEIVATRPVLQEMFKEVFGWKENNIRNLDLQKEGKSIKKGVSEDKIKTFIFLNIN